MPLGRERDGAVDPSADWLRWSGLAGDLCILILQMYRSP
jgi:hypothetical protein